MQNAPFAAGEKNRFSFPCSSGRSPAKLSLIMGLLANALKPRPLPVVPGGLMQGSGSASDPNP